MGMFDFLLGVDDYEERKLERFEKDELLVSTAFVTDISRFETAIRHPTYNNGRLVIVELYDDAVTAKAGHDKWVATMTSEKLPDRLIDVSESAPALALSRLSGPDWRNKPKKAD